MYATHAIAITNRQRLSIAISKSQAFAAEIAMKSKCYKVFSESQSFFELRLQSKAIWNSKSLRFGSLSCQNFNVLSGPPLGAVRTHNFCSQGFWAPRIFLGYHGFSCRISHHKFVFPGLWGTYQSFWPPPLHMFDPHPHPKTSGPPKACLCASFSCLAITLQKIIWTAVNMEILKF